MSIAIEDLLPPGNASGFSFRKTVAFQVAPQIASGVALTAGGALVASLGSSVAVGPNVYAGSGVPTISAPQGSLYLRSDGSSTSTRAYINNSAGSGTTWTALTTAA
jgi:hypothetical protein